MTNQRYSVTPHSIETILTWVKSGEIAIPEIQRTFVTNVWLLEYAKKCKCKKVVSAINKPAKDLLKTNDSGEKDRHWLLIYQVWSKKELEGNMQGFLAKLKSKNFEFFSMPEETNEELVEVVIQDPPQQPEAMKA